MIKFLNTKLKNLKEQHHKRQTEKNAGGFSSSSVRHILSFFPLILNGKNKKRKSRDYRENEKKIT